MLRAWRLGASRAKFFRFVHQKIKYLNKPSDRYVIPAMIKSVIIVGHFVIARTVPPSFADHGPKLRVLIIAKWEWPEMAKNRGEP